MVFNPNIPNAGDKLSASQPVLRANNQQLDTSFGEDHYKFSDGTSNNGFHKYMTTPSIAIPITTDSPKIYGNQLTANIGTIQFSKARSDAVFPATNSIAPTPITNFNGLIPSMAVLTTVPLLDFSGVTTSVFTVSIVSQTPSNFSVFGATVFGGVLGGIRFIGGGAATGLKASGNILNVFTGQVISLTNTYWFIEFLRLE